MIELAARNVCIAPIKLQPDGNYMKQVARFLTDYEQGFLKGKRYLIHDRDPWYITTGFHNILRSSGIAPAKLPARSPVVKSVKSECLDHLILSLVEQLDYAFSRYEQYYHHERIHQSPGRIIEPKHKLDDQAEVQGIERLGGLLKSYHRLAA